MIHIHAPAPERVTVRWSLCGDCGRRSPFVTVSYVWYGPTNTCMRCGRRYNEDGFETLAFSRTARTDNKDDARRVWRGFKARLTKAEIDGIAKLAIEKFRARHRGTAYSY